MHNDIERRAPESPSDLSLDWDGLVTCELPTPLGDFKLNATTDPETGRELVALTMGLRGPGNPC